MLQTESTKDPSFDAVVIGAGFSGLYMLYRLRKQGLKACIFEKGSGVGGAWYWSRYPGARCDSESYTYNYTFSEELYQEWTWRSRYPGQAEILQYLNFVADRLDLRKDIQLNREITGASYKAKENHWEVEVDEGQYITCKYLISAVGCLSVHAKNMPNIPGIEDFQGEWYHTGSWPHTKVDFTGKRVGVIGSGSSGIQCIPVIAEEASELYSFQRTPQYAIPAGNHPYNEKDIKEYKLRRSETREKMFSSRTGYPFDYSNKSAMEDTDEQRQAAFESAWSQGGFQISAIYNDLLVNEQSNETFSHFVKNKMKAIIHDQSLANKMLPNYYIATKRLVLDTNYYETFNRSHVHFVDVKTNPITHISEKGLCTTEKEYPLDALVFATGYDGMTGPLLKLNLRGKKGRTLTEKWQNGADVKTYLGLMTAEFPNLFMITGPQSPSVATNMPTSIEQHVDWISDCIQFMEQRELTSIEADVTKEKQWGEHCEEVYQQTLYAKTPSWYSGANIEGKPQSFLIYLGGLNQYGKFLKHSTQNLYNDFDFRESKANIIK